MSLSHPSQHDEKTQPSRNESTTQKSTKPMSGGQEHVALKASGVGTWDWDLISNQLVWSNEEKTLFGLSPTDPISYERFLKALHPDDRERVNQINTRTLTGEQQQEQSKEFRTIWPDGSIHWLADRAQYMYNAQGKPVHLTGITIDITAQKQVEEALSQSKEELRILTEMMPQLVWATRPDGFIDYFNQQCYTYFNTTFEQISGEQWIKMIHPDDRQKTLTVWKTALQTGQSYEIEYRMREGKTGEYQWFLGRAEALTDDQGHILKWFGTSTNIDKQKRTEEALRESELRFHRLMDSNTIGIIVSNLQGIVREANDAFLSLVGYTKEELAAGQVSWMEMTPPEYQAQSVQSVEKLLATGVMQPFEKEYETRAGKRVPVLLGSTLFRQRDSSPLLITFVLDLTDRKELERQKDLMLGMTSHELKTPLAALKGTFQLIQRRVKRLLIKAEAISPEMNAFLTDTLERLTGCARQVDVQTHLINDLMDVSRITAHTLKLELGHCDLVHIVHETVKDLRMVAPERSLLEDLPENTTVTVLADQARVGQVITNYITNAIRYSSPDQPVSIGITIQGDIARIWVHDKGPGLTAEAQKELWQRFHQVKGVPVQSGSGKGLGLGLYICQTLIAQHKGEVGVESTPGEGSTFWFTLPIVK